MSFLERFGRHLGNKLYKVGFPIYRPLYAVFKAYADRSERRLLLRSVRPGHVVVDAGANIGIYSQFLAKRVGPNGVVHSFEPAPENFRRLSAALAELTNVRLNPLALSDTSQESLLYISESLNVDHRAYQTAGEPRATCSIRFTTLDDYFAPTSHVDLIKMDIQGYELHALRGAERVLRDNPDVKLLIEFWPYGLNQAGASAEALLDFLMNHGFALYLSSGDRLTTYRPEALDSRDPARYFNLFARREG